MDDVIVFDSLGVMSQLDLYPAVPCGNLWKVEYSSHNAMFELNLHSPVYEWFAGCLG